MDRKLKLLMKVSCFRVLSLDVDMTVSESDWSEDELALALAYKKSKGKFASRPKVNAPTPKHTYAGHTSVGKSHDVGKSTVKSKFKDGPKK